MDEPNPGDLCRAYYNTGTDAVPVWVEVNKCKDLWFPFQLGEAEADARDNEWRSMEPTLIGVEITFGYQYEPGADTVFDALITMALARTSKQFAIADGDIATSGTRYLKAFCKVFGVGNEQPLDGVETKEFTLKPCRKKEAAALIKPAWVTVA